MPAKFEATPESLISGPPSRPRQPEITEYAIRNPKIPPASAATKLISMLVR
jgi:hypothetical protein